LVKSKQCRQVGEKILIRGGKVLSWFSFFFFSVSFSFISPSFFKLLLGEKIWLLSKMLDLCQKNTTSGGKI
jgi:hypothetical protein